MWLKLFMGLIVDKILIWLEILFKVVLLQILQSVL